MKLSDLLENDDDDDLHLTPLKDLSKHNYHGRVWIGPEQAQKAVDAAHDSADDDTPIWHDWMNDAGTVYEVSFSATSKPEVMKIIDAIKNALPRPPHSFWCYKEPGRPIEHRDWIAV